MRGRPFTFDSFGGGLNVADSIYQLSEKEARDCRNVVATPRGAIRKRNGSEVLAKPAVALDSLFAMVAENPFGDALIGQGAAALYAIDPTGAITTITGTSGATSGKRWEFATAPAKGGQGPLYGMDGTATAQWTGSGVAAPWTAATGTLPVGQFLHYHGNRMFVAGMAAYTPSGGSALDDARSAVVFSEPGDVRNWPAENVVQFDPGDGEAISGLAAVGPYVLVFKPSKTWVIYDLDTGANRQIADNAGCVAHRSIAETPKGTMFLSRDQGVMVTDGNSVKAVSDKVKPLLDTLAPAQRAFAAGVFFDKHYYLSIATAGVTNDLTFDYQLDLDAWWVHTLPAQQWAVWDRGGQASLYLARGAAVSGVFTVEEAFVDGQSQDSVGYSGDLGVNIDAYWKGVFHTFGAPYLNKRVRRIHFDGSGTVDAYFATDFANYEQFDQTMRVEDPSGDWGDSEPGGGGRELGGGGGGQIVVGEGEILTPGVARAWSVMFRNNASTTFEVESYTMAITPRKD
jgi:hypothetical protein